MTAIFTYDQTQAVKAGQSSFINETGAYIGKILTAKWTKSQGGAKALELSFETDDGLKADYLSIYYTTKTGEPIQNGHNMIQAIMGCTGVKQLTSVSYKDFLVAPELTEKRLGLFLQKVLRLKQDGTETHNFQIQCPFSAQSRKTLAEFIENRPAERIDWLVAHTKDKDERAKQTQQNGYGTYNQAYGQAVGGSQNQPWDGYADNERPAGNPPPADFDDDIPF
ncbi:hypothetical protein A4G19_13825 [Pasteurellaceae bacterium Macca]|nr:hypothetical protein [Pasteurellaceae bacterium Macca]MCK3656757.1 hypothetical protein [Pasteurellaceae bacterium Macca]